MEWRDSRYQLRLKGFPLYRGFFGRSQTSINGYMPCVDSRTPPSGVLYVCVRVFFYVTPYQVCYTVLSICPLHTNSGCGKERRILLGLWREPVAPVAQR